MAQVSQFDRRAFQSLAAHSLDDLPYGVIVVDDAGFVTAYNLAESRAVGIPRERVLGKNFFLEVAPCTQVKQFQGSFEEFARGKRSAVEPFEFVFPFPSGAQRVTILFVRDEARSTSISIIVLRNAVTP